MKPFLSLLVAALVIGGPLLANLASSRAVRNFRAVSPEVYRSGQMSPAGFERVLREHEIRSVVSFREGKDEFEEEACRAKGVKFFRLEPKRWSTPEGTVPAKENVAEFLAILDDPKTPRPLLVHCFAGVHRTGAYVAIYRMEYEGWTREEAIAEMLAIGEGKGQFEADQLDFLRGYERRKRLP